MKRHGLGIAFQALAAGLIFSAVGMAQDFHKTFTIRPEGIIRIRTISGEVRVRGYDGTTIEVDGFKTGRDRERVEIQDRSGEGRVDVDVRYPENGNCEAGVNFRVRVPRGVSYTFDVIRSISGNVYVDDVTGHLQAESISGSVDIRNVTGVVSATATSGDVNVENVSGIVSANSTSGDVDVLLKKIAGTGDMKFTSISGNVMVRVPANLDASISMQTLSGTLATDFPIEILQRRYVPGYSARGRLGKGTYSIVIRSVSGRVSLMKGQV